MSQGVIKSILEVAQHSHSIASFDVLQILPTQYETRVSSELQARLLPMLPMWSKSSYIHVEIMSRNSTLCSPLRTNTDEIVHVQKCSYADQASNKSSTLNKHQEGVTADHVSLLDS